MKSVQFSLTCPASIVVGSAVALDFQDGVIGPATVIGNDSGGPQFRVYFKEAFANAHYVVATTPSPASADLAVIERSTEYLDWVFENATSGRKVDAVCLGN